MGRMQVRGQIQRDNFGVPGTAVDWMFSVIATWETIELESNTVPRLDIVLQYCIFWCDAKVCVTKVMHFECSLIVRS